MNDREESVILENYDKLSTRKLKPYGLMESFQVNWIELSYVVKKGIVGKQKVILNNVSGFYKSEHLTAIMGPSGCGKSSLLKCLTGKIKTGLFGSITISTDKTAKVAYVPQDDYLLSRITVRESITYSSKLKNKHTVDHDSVVESLLEKLNLEKCAETRASNCSGGQRKRISIALELVCRPNILILDEPTSGLDTVATRQLISLLIELTAESEPMAIVLTIHQPSGDVFAMFSALYLLSYDGQCIYHGSPNNMLKLFDKYKIVCPQFHNPADFAIELASKDHGISKVMMLSTIMRIDALGLKCYNNTLNVIQKRTTISDIWILTKRSFKLSVRDAYTLPISIVSNVITAFLLATLYGTQSGETGGCQSELMSLTSNNNGSNNGGNYFENYSKVYFKVNDNIICIFFMNMFIWWSSMFPILLSFPIEMNVLYKEYGNGWYSCFSYFLAKVFSDLPFLLAIPNFFSLTSYKTTGQLDEQWRLVYFAVICLLMAFLANSQGLMTSALFMHSPTAAVLVGMISTFPLLFFSGFLKRLERIPAYLQWLGSIDFVRYGLESSILTIYGFDRCSQHSVNQTTTTTDWTDIIPFEAVIKMQTNYDNNVSNSVNPQLLFDLFKSFSTPTTDNAESVKSLALINYGLDDSDLYYNLSILVILMIVYRVFTYLILYRKLNA